MTSAAFALLVAMAAGPESAYTLKVADAPDLGPAAAAKGKAAAPTPPFAIKVLLDDETVKSTRASLTRLVISPANRIAMHRTTSARVLYVVSGHARLLGAAGVPPQKLDPGFAAHVPAGMPIVLENMGRQTPAVLLQAFAPSGPERVFRDPKDEKARASFEVIRDAGKVKAPEGAKVSVAKAESVPALPLTGGKGTARIVFDPQATGDASIALDVLEMQPGATVPQHKHDASSELLYMLAGAGEMEVAGTKFPIGADQAIFVPENTPHGAHFAAAEPSVLVQIYAPAGPEQRFREPPPAPAKAPAPGVKP